VKRWRKSYTAGKLTRTEEVTRDEPVVQASEISNLPDLVAYVKFGEDFPITKVKTPYIDYKERAQAIMITGQAA
ncbi:type IV secretion system DNA-binding domain-containing protein, partial [Streptomyces sp. IBSBF 2807]|nr:type IV secretion system DNA-binding domain-containing protein [Streptomyces hilarionis]